MPGVVETSPSLLTALLEHARTLLHLDHALFADWNEEEGTTTIVAAVGVLPGREVSAVGVPFPISDYYGSQTEMTDALPLMEPMLLQRSDRDLPPLLAAYMDRVGIAQELYVHLDADPPRRWVLECMYADPDQAVGSAERERALELARLAKAVIESERMAAALRDDEARQRMLVEALPVLVYQIDEHDRATVPSPGPLVVKLGSGPQEWQSDPYRHWLEHMHPDDRDRILASWRKSKRGRLRFDDEYRMVGADGRVAWVRDTAVPVLEIDAAELVWHGVIMDITDRVEVAERLRMSEESHRALVERVPAMVYVQHTYDRSTVLNLGGFPAMLGYSDDEWVDPDRTWVELVHPGDVARVETAWHGAWAARQPFEEEYRLVGRNGRVVWVRDSALPTSGTDWHGITFDVTDLVETAERLREAQSRYQSLVEQIPVVTYLDDPTGKGIYVSPQVEGMLGVPVERWLGTYDAWLQAVHPDDAPLVDQRFRGMLERGAWFDAEYRVVLPDGTMRWVHDRARPIHDAEGNVSLVQGIIVDVTDRRLVAHATEQQARRQRAIADLGMMALEGLESRRLCEEAATAAMETLGGCGAGVFRSDGGDLLELIAGAGVVRDEPLCFRPTISGGSPAGQALVSDQPVICEDLEAETRFTVCSQIIGLGLRSCACVKIAGAGRPYGVLAVYSRRPSTFGSDDIDFLQAIANVLAAALERERVQAALELSEQQRQRVLAELLRSADEERARIATELHDDTIQVMTAALIGLDRLSNSEKRGDRPAADHAARVARQMLAEAVERTRRLTFELRPPLLQARGLEAAVRDLVEESARAAGFEAVLHAAIDRQAAAVESLCYRTVQELVANARKHAAASRLEVRLWQEEGTLAAEVHDDGVGFDVDRAFDRSLTRLHLGLDSAAERIRLAGGQMTVDSRPGNGTRVCFTIPT